MSIARTVNRAALREALHTVGIHTKDLTELVITPHAVTVTRIARDGNGNTYPNADHTGIATGTSEHITITES